MKNVINWFEIPAADMDRAVRFYEGVLATKLKRENFGGSDMAVFPHPDAQQTGGALVKREGSKPWAAGTVVYLDVGGDLDGAVARVQKAGGKVLVPRTEIGPDGAFAVIVDTEGNGVGLHTHAAASA
jgi:predicted enzyme related to lactoylglutathione lyase